MLNGVPLGQVLALLTNTLIRGTLLKGKTQYG